MARSQHNDDEADEDEIPPPPPKKPAVKARLVEDEAPRKKKKKSKQKPEADKKKLLIIGGAIAAVLLTFGCISLVAYFVFFNGGSSTASDSPKIAYLDWISAEKAQDADRVWERMDQETQKVLLEEKEQLAKKEPDVEKYKGKTGKALYLAVMAANYKPPSGPLPDASFMPVVVSQTVNGTVGSVTLKRYKAPNLTIPCVQENGRWKLQLQRTRSDPE